MTFPPIDTTAMDQATLQRVIADMLKDLRDEAIGSHKDVTHFITWKFRDFPSSAYSFDYNPITRNYNDNGGLPKKWDDSGLENLFRGLSDGRVQAIALDEQMQTLGKSTVRDTGTKSSSKRMRLPHKLRDRLIETIEAAIGRPLDPRSAKHIDPRKSDPDPPNLYKWQFSGDYPGFPEDRGGISRWHADRIHACQKALKLKHLTVMNVEPGSSESMKSSEVEIDSTCASKHGRSSIKRAAETHLVNSPPSSNRANVNVNRSQSMTREILGRTGSVHTDAAANVLKTGQHLTSEAAPKGLEELQIQISSMLNSALKSQADELETQWKSLLTTEQRKFQTEHTAHRETLENLLDLKRESEKIRTRLGQLERDLEDRASNAIRSNKAQARVTQLERELEEQVTLAKTEGRLSMEEKLQDLDNTVEAERRALRRIHLEQLDEARAEWYERGFQAGRDDIDTSEITRSVPDQRNTDLESLDGQSGEELPRDRPVGRQNAYMELSPEPDVNIDLQNDDDTNIKRKIRELKTIHQNWHDIPQRVLPSYMLPEGHIPTSTTLYLLAKLSQELDSSIASQLLAEEIDERCKNSSELVKCRIVKNSDIQKVLERNYQDPTESGSWASVGESQTPPISSRDRCLGPRRSFVVRSVESSVRPVLGDVSGASKRPVVASRTPNTPESKRRKLTRAGNLPSRDREFHRSAQLAKPSVEVRGPTIFVAPSSKLSDSLDAKPNLDEENGDSDDLYSLPRVRRRVSSK